MIVRGYQDKDIARMIAIWNEIVAEGVAFPQEECLTEETGRAFFASHELLYLRTCQYVYILSFDAFPTVLVGSRGQGTNHARYVCRCMWV